MQETIISNKPIAMAFDLPRCQEIYFSTYKDCRRKITPVFCEIISNPEEADTKIVLHCCHALTRHPSKKILVRSHSGDTDILVILLNKLVEHQDRVYLDYGSGKHRKGFWLADIDLSEDI